MIQPEVSQFIPSALTVNYGDNVSFTWSTSDATSVQLTSSPQMQLPSNLAVNQPTPVAIGPITQGTGFTLTALNGTVIGKNQSQNIDVYPPTCAFTGQAGSGTPGNTVNIWEKDPVILTWDITSAATVTIDPPLSNGPSLTNLTGSLTINPPSSVTYTLTVTGVNDITVSQQVTITAQLVQIMSFTAAPNPLELPADTLNQATLSWSVNAQQVAIPGVSIPAGASSVVINNPVDGTVYTLNAGTNLNPVILSQPLTIHNFLGPFGFNSLQPFSGMYFVIALNNALSLTYLNPFISTNAFSVTLTGVISNLQANQMAMLIMGLPDGPDGGPVNAILVPWPLPGVSGSPQTLDLRWENPSNPAGTMTFTGMLPLPQSVESLFQND
jgi:hypothetical protein